MAISVENSSYTTISSNNGDNLTIVPGVGSKDTRYDFIDESGAWHMHATLIEDDKNPRPEFQVVISEDDGTSISHHRAINCARIALGLMTVDSAGRILAGVRYDEDNSTLPVKDIFPGVHQTQTEHFIGQAAVRDAIPNGFLKD